jgi:hypothetical protein
MSEIVMPGAATLSRLHPAGFVEPCLPTPARAVPTGPQGCVVAVSASACFPWTPCERVRRGIVPGSYRQWVGGCLPQYGTILR